MSERTAILLVLAVAGPLVLAAIFGLAALDAPNGAIALVSIAILAVSSDTVAKVVIHYGDKRRSEKRRRD